MQTKIDFKKSLLRCLLVLLAVAVTVTMTPVNMEKVYAESADTVLTVNGTAYTKAQLLDMESEVDTFSYTYKDENITDVVKGVSLETLLKGSDPSYVVEFGNADNTPQNISKSRQNITVKDLIEAKGIIAYMCGKDENTLAEFTDTSKSGMTGCLRLYTNNGERYDKLVNSIKVTEPSTGEETPGTGGNEETKYDLVFTGNAVKAEKNYSLDEFKKDPKIEVQRNVEYSYTNNWDTDGAVTITGATIKNILEDVVGLKTNYAQITFYGNGIDSKTYDVSELYKVDIDGHMPMLAWKVIDGTKETKDQFKLIIGKKDAADKNKPNWIGEIYKIEVNIKTGELSKPASIKAARASYNSVKLTWSAVNGADGYCVEKYDSKAKKFKEAYDVTANTKTITKLNTGTEYKFRVKAYYSIDGVKTYSKATDVAKATPTLSKPAITKITAGSKKITVKWTKVDGANGYKIYRATSKSGKYNLIKTVKSGKTTYYTNKSLTKGKKYYYKVKAYRNTASSSYSTVKYARAK